MLTKPKPPVAKPNSKPERLRRKCVTIAAGFRCVDGIMLCADTQETLGFLKRKHPKLDVRGAQLPVHIAGGTA